MTQLQQITRVLALALVAFAVPGTAFSQMEIDRPAPSSPVATYADAAQVLFSEYATPSDSALAAGLFLALHPEGPYADGVRTRCEVLGIEPTKIQPEDADIAERLQRLAQHYPHIVASDSAVERPGSISGLSWPPKPLAPHRVALQVSGGGGLLFVEDTSYLQIAIGVNAEFRISERLYVGGSLNDNAWLLSPSFRVLSGDLSFDARRKGGQARLYPFVLVGAGAVHLYGEKPNTAPAVCVGGGAKLRLFKYIGLRLDARIYQPLDEISYVYIGWAGTEYSYHYQPKDVQYFQAYLGVFVSLW